MDKVLTLLGHLKKIYHVAFRKREGQPTLLLSGCANKIACVWSSDSSLGEYRPSTIIKTHKGDVARLAVRPSLILLPDKTYFIHNLNDFSERTAPLPRRDRFSLFLCTRMALSSPQVHQRLPFASIMCALETWLQLRSHLKTPFCCQHPEHLGEWPSPPYPWSELGST